MRLRQIKTDNLIPYERNPRKNDNAVDMVANSIKEFGFKVPIVIDKNKVVVCGHTRLKAAKRLGMEKVPCIVADDLTDEQIKAFRLADNRVAEQAEWDYDILNEEIAEILSFDMEDFGFELFDPEYEHEINKERTQERVKDIVNLGKGHFEGVGKYDIPIIKPVTSLPPIKEWIGFNYVLSDDDPTGKAVHFFMDDYQFERVWNDPERYAEKLSRYACVATPDFSPYGDMPNALQIYNHYRKHWCGAYWQSLGITVIPTIRASTDPRCYEWYLDGEPHNGIVLISSMWTGKDSIRKEFQREYDTMVETLKPTQVLMYGNIPDGINGDIIRIENFTEKRWKNSENKPKISKDVI